MPWLHCMSSRDKGGRIGPHRCRCGKAKHWHVVAQSGLLSNVGTQLSYARDTSGQAHRQSHICHPGTRSTIAGVSKVIGIASNLCQYCQPLRMFQAHIDEAKPTSKVMMPLKRDTGLEEVHFDSGTSSLESKLTLFCPSLPTLCFTRGLHQLDYIVSTHRCKLRRSKHLQPSRVCTQSSREGQAKATDLLLGELHSDASRCCIGLANLF